MRGPSDAIYPSVTLRGCDGLCHRSATARWLGRQGSDLWVKPGCCALSVSADDDSGGCRWGVGGVGGRVGLGGAGASGSWWMFAGRYSEQSEPRQTNPDGDLEAPMWEVKEKMKEGSWQMHRQTKWRWKWPRVARGEQRDRKSVV